MKKLCLITILALVALAPVSRAQQTLPALVDEGGVAWLVAEWQAQSPSGGSISLTYRWDLNKHIVTAHLKTPEMESRGLIGLDSNSGEVTYVAYDDQGGSGSGVWTAEYGVATLKYTHRAPDGEIRKMGVVYTKLDSDRMRVAFHGLDSSGELEQTARWDVEFTRKKA